MAEFKLGRIRFIWKDNWSSSTIYYKDDIVRNGGNTYICIQGHTSPSLFTTDQSTYWNKISDGVEWKDVWQTSTYYKVNDIVKYGGYLYIANTAHTSAASATLGLEDDQANWDLFAEGFDYLADWSITFRYKINDIVKYNGTIYICTEGHTSASNLADGLEVDQAKWDIFSEGFYWRDTWSTNTRYRKNDVVRYGGQLYVANTGHTSALTETLGLEDDQAKWDYLHKGIEYKGDWASTTRYKINDVVKYGGGLWICITFHTSQTFLTDDEAKWAQFVEGLEFEDSWDKDTRYQPGDFVTFGGYSYVSVTNNIGAKPTENDADWDLFTTGFKFVGEWGEDSSNQHYKVGDVVTKNGYTYLCILDHDTNQEPPNSFYWEKLNSGFKWRDDVGSGDGSWTDAIEYKLGDVVSYSINSYVCVNEHTSDETVNQNRPDQDVAGAYWNILSGGPESGNLTTAGDLVYYGGAGPARLPIGQPGQVLVVNDLGDSPEWKSFGSINNIYYVETNNGVDNPAPSYGITLDRPWKTIRYATEQVEKGPLRPNSRYMIEINKAFIQEESIEWMNAQIVGGAGIWAGFTVDDAGKCRRDIGQIVDALLWDLGHNGNERTREAALSYFNNGSLIASIQDEDEQLVAVIEYMETVIDAVISNLLIGTDTGTKYGTLTQTQNSSYPEESDAQTTIASLLDIITDSITAGIDTNIPAEYKPNNSIFVKTGEFLEVLPISVPENTAVIGDELRSTRIKPAGSLVATGDVPYSIAGITQLGTNIAALLAGDNDGDPTADGLSSFSGESVDTTISVADSTVAADAQDLIQQIIDYIDWGVNGATGDSTEPKMAGSNTPNTAEEYTKASELLEKNRTYLVEEVISYIAATYPAYSYNADKCRRDINTYIDAIKYDLIYTGNYKSLLAARYYVNAVNGSTQEDMFYMRNGTGLRNCTVQGLSGSLGSPNEYGTRRPSAGAFVSLDPGWGPNDTRVWIINKSPYVQNVTTFGDGCIGCKIDGALHNGGNDSIVANDFTQIVSDGIGVWCTNLGRTELVSVFSYYAHIGYLAENGGKIRATNGNSSYGDYGTVAESVDETETPISGFVDNQSLNAVVRRVTTDGDEILTFEYLNAGQGYTSGNTVITVTGEGFGASINTPQVADGAVFEVRLRDYNDSSEDFGGADYTFTENVAQGGTSTSITLSNTDTTVLANQYQGTGSGDGVAIFITAGKGAGQYGYIDSYNPGTKVANIKKFSDDTAGWDHLTGAPIEATLDESTNYSIEPHIVFSAPPSGLYADTAKARAIVEDGKIVQILIWDPGNGYNTAPTMTVYDPNNTADVPHTVRIGDGVLTQPTWTNRGNGFVTASAEIAGDGFADIYQPGSNIQISSLSDIPLPGSNVTFDNLPGQFYKLVNVRNLEGNGPYSAQLQISPELGIEEAPDHDTAILARIRYSQVRLTGHDYLDIGTGNFAETNYPGSPQNDPDPEKEVIESGGGRVFYTSTDQDGNFRVGRLFNVEQATGTATLNADAFNISGLQELQLGSVELGGTGAVITEFSTDGTFTAISDNIVPTQKAIKTYIASQIGGGAGELNVNSITAGSILISTNEITTTTGNEINILQKVNYTGGIDGDPVALNYFLQA